MARFSFNEADNYGVGKSNYFSLKDNGDTAKVRFLYNDINDIQGVAVHTVQDGDKQIDVECIRSYNEPISKCPLCQAGYKQNAKLFIKVYDETDNESKIWTRGKTFFSKLSSLCARYNPLVSTPFEIERIGKKGDTNTVYETYPMQSDNKQVTDFPEVEAEGTCFHVKTYNELDNYVKTGYFENNTTHTLNRDMNTRNREVSTNAPIRRRPKYNEEDNF